MESTQRTECLTSGCDNNGTVWRHDRSMELAARCPDCDDVLIGQRAAKEMKDNIESDKEAFRVGFITALKWVMAGQEGIIEQLEEDFDLEIVEVSQN